MKYERNEDTEAKVWQIINTDDDFARIQIAQPKICVLDCLMKKKSEGRLVFADIRPVQDMYKALVDFDYIIVIYTGNTVLLSDEQFMILLEHEIRHIDIRLGREGTIYGTVGHDIEDFYAIIDKYGMDWSTWNAKTQNVSGESG